MQYLWGLGLYWFLYLYFLKFGIYKIAKNFFEGPNRDLLPDQSADPDSGFRFACKAPAPGLTRRADKALY